VACLHRAGHRVALLAPRGAGSALVGPGPGEVRLVLPWDAARIAELFTEAGPSNALRQTLGGFDAAVAFSRHPDLARNLGALIPRLVVHDPLPPAGSGHAAEWLARPVSSLGAPCAEEPPTLEATSDEAQRAAVLVRDLPDRFLAVHPGSGSRSKTWPADRFSGLVKALGIDRFLLVEGPADAEAVAAVRASCQGAVLAPGLPARVLGATLAHAAAFVGNDSGVTHLAAAWGVPTVALFGPTDPDVWSPVGPRVTVVRSPHGGMDGIAVDAVAAAMARLLAETGPR
jgi:glycosyl transferase family 9 (putative heptosyltransferase)